METINPSEAKYISGRRFALAIISWLFASIGILNSLMFSGAGIFGGGAFDGMLLLGSILPLFAWASLAVMTVNWLKDRRCHRFWPVFGFVVGVASAGMYAALCIFYISAIPLACYLTYWHWRRDS